MYCMHVLSKAFNQSTENIHASNDIFSALMSHCSSTKNKGKVTIFLHGVQQTQTADWWVNEVNIVVKLML